MGLLAFGLNHRTAGIDLRERLTFSPDRLRSALEEARTHAHFSELVILSTCNRTEIYGVTETRDAEPLLKWLEQYHQVGIPQIRECSYEYWEQDAVRHLMRVASGLDSMVLGEPQILGQLKQAYADARSANAVGPQLFRLFQQVFSVAKLVRTETGIGANPVSVAYAAVSLTRHIFSNLTKTRALLIGAGETVELVARHLCEQGVRDITVANRTLSRANDLAEKFSGKAVVLSDIPRVLPSADIVISSTASPLPILGKGTVEQALKIRRHKPVFMMDIAVPRDIEEEVGQLADVYLYTVDDLQQVVEENRMQRQKAAGDAESIIEQRCSQYMQSLRGLNAVDTITQYRRSVEDLRIQELEKALELLKKGCSPEEALERMSKSFANKLMHAPTVAMKKAGEENRVELLEWSEDLLGLKNRKSET